MDSIIGYLRKHWIAGFSTVLIGILTMVVPSMYSSAMASIDGFFNHQRVAYAEFVFVRNLSKADTPLDIDQTIIKHMDDENDAFISSAQMLCANNDMQIIETVVGTLEEARSVCRLVGVVIRN